MYNQLGADDLFNLLMMLDAGMVRPTLVVEGESDYNLVNDHLEGVDIEVGYGKASMVLVAARIRDEGVEVGFLVDADFDNLTKRSESFGDNVFITQHYDLWMDLHLSRPEVMDRILRRYIALPNHAKVVRSITTLAISAALAIGRVRYVSSVMKLNVALGDFPTHTLFAESNIDAMIDKVVTIGCSNSKGGADAMVVRSSVDAFEFDLIDDPMLLVNSHDFFDATLKAARKWSSGVSDLEPVYSVAVVRDHFEGVEVLSRIREWVGRSSVQSPDLHAKPSGP